MEGAHEIKCEAFISCGGGPPRPSLSRLGTPPRGARRGLFTFVPYLVLS
jgi:hypothetical protein